MNTAFFGAGLPPALNPKLLVIDLDPGREPAASADVHVLPAGRDRPGADDRAAGCVRAARRYDQDPEPRQRRARPGPGYTAAGHRRAAGDRPLAHPPAAGPSPAKGQAAAETGS